MKCLSRFSKQSFSIFLLSFFTGTLYSQIIPTLTPYLLQRFEAGAFEIGIFYTVLAVFSILSCQVSGRLSDISRNRPRFVIVGLSIGGLACLVLAFSSSFASSVYFGASILGISALAAPQIMAYARDYAEVNLNTKNIPLFNSYVRISFALSWVVGPPAGYLLQDLYGAINHYLFSGALHFLLATSVVGLIKKVPTTYTYKLKQKKNLAINVTHQKLATYFVVFSILFSLNQMYLIALPQFLVASLNVELNHAGLLMGIAALIEIPVMVLGGVLASKMAIEKLIQIGAACALVFYLGLYFSESLLFIYILQIFNGIFIGIIASLGLTWFQDQMPSRAGFASSLFGNSVNTGILAGSLAFGWIVSQWGLRILLLVCGLAATFSLAILLYQNVASKLARRIEPLNFSLEYH
ncbi:MFS transporter [Teredinibacter waterburyi]|uniref:MFS transporter n=1 Tax=Teredinibacter waterburyi TaxID=1500538 RepID=UPI00165F8702|nr:MFS transporter [Teredinibacter waterburyi]